MEKKFRKALLAGAAALGLGIAVEQTLKTNGQNEVKETTSAKEMAVGEKQPLAKATPDELLVEANRRAREEREKKVRREVDQERLRDLRDDIQGGAQEKKKTDDQGVVEAIRGIFPDVKIVDSGSDALHHVRPGEFFLVRASSSPISGGENYILTTVDSAPDTLSFLSGRDILYITIQPDGGYLLSPANSNSMDISCDASTLKEAVGEFAEFNQIVSDEKFAQAVDLNVTDMGLEEVRSYYAQKLEQIKDARERVWQYLPSGSEWYVSALDTAEEKTVVSLERAKRDLEMPHSE